MKNKRIETQAQVVDAITSGQMDDMDHIIAAGIVATFAKEALSAGLSGICTELVKQVASAGQASDLCAGDKLTELLVRHKDVARLIRVVRHLSEFAVAAADESIFQAVQESMSSQSQSQSQSQSDEGWVEPSRN